MAWSGNNESDPGDYSTGNISNPAACDANETAAANNHGMPRSGNGVGGDAGTHMKHARQVPPPIEGGN
jgi:hypothetical protein